MSDKKDETFKVGDYIASLFTRWFKDSDKKESKVSVVSSSLSLPLILLLSSSSFYTIIKDKVGEGCYLHLLKRKMDPVSFMEKNVISLHFLYPYYYIHYHHYCFQ